MKWYWILIIVLAVIAVGVIIGLAVKKSKKASSPAKKEVVKALEKPATNVTVSSGNGVEVVKKDNADGSKTIAVSRTAGE